jgi:hypothetical protein
MASTRIRVLVLLALALAGCKVPCGSAGDDDLAAGTVSGSQHENKMYGFSLNIPDEWQVMPPSEHVKLLSGMFGFSYPLRGSWFVNDRLIKFDHPGTVLLLGVDRHTDTPLRERIVVLTDQASRYHPPLASVSDYVSKLAHEQVKVQRGQLLHDAYSVDCGGKGCYRADYKENYSGGSVYRSFVATGLKGFLPSWTFVANSQETLDAMVDTLHQISFLQ